MMRYFLSLIKDTDNNKAPRFILGAFCFMYIVCIYKITDWNIIYVIYNISVM